MSYPFRFKDRQHAGRLLAERLLKVHVKQPVIVLGLPRGGVPVAAEVAKALGAKIDIITVRKIGAPGHAELACGALASGGILVWNHGVLHSLGLTPEDLAPTVSTEAREILKRERSIRTPDTPPLALKGASVILVDDGLATGATMRAAIKAVQAQAPRQLIVALPVGPEDTCRELERAEGVKLVCLNQIAASDFGSVGQWYEDFSQVETDQCREILVLKRAVKEDENSAATQNDSGF